VSSSRWTEVQGRCPGCSAHLATYTHPACLPLVQASTMTKGSKRQKIKDALSPVRNLVSPSNSGSSAPNTISPNSTLSTEDDNEDVLDDLLAELDSRGQNGAAQAEAGQIVREMQAADQSSTSKGRSRSRHQARQVSHSLA
jgi:hypothetical protein